MIRIPKLPHLHLLDTKRESSVLISMDISIDEELRELEEHMVMCPDMSPAVQAAYDRLVDSLKAAGLELLAPPRPGQHHWEERAKLLEIKATLDERRKEVAEELGVLDN